MRANTLAFKIRDLMLRECPDAKPALILSLMDVIHTHEQENIIIEADRKKREAEQKKKLTASSPAK